MTEFDQTNSGSIWKNDKKEKDTHPDFTGSLNVGGVEYWVSAWKRKPGAKDKSPALSFSVKLKEERCAVPAKGSKKQDFGDDMDGDSIPF